jgi:hypothetical protein
MFNKVLLTPSKNGGDTPLSQTVVMKNDTVNGATNGTSGTTTVSVNGGTTSGTAGYSLKYAGVVKPGYSPKYATDLEIIR